MPGKRSLISRWKMGMSSAGRRTLDGMSARLGTWQCTVQSSVFAVRWGLGGNLGQVEIPERAAEHDVLVRFRLLALQGSRLKGGKERGMR